MRILFFFSWLNAKTKTEGGESYLQFGTPIKMQIVRNHFSALTMEVQSLQHTKTVRWRNPPESTKQFYLFTETLWHGEQRGVYFFLIPLYISVFSGSHYCQMKDVLMFLGLVRTTSILFTGKKKQKTVGNTSLEVHENCSSSSGHQHPVATHGKLSRNVKASFITQSRTRWFF